MASPRPVVGKIHGYEKLRVRRWYRHLMNEATKKELKECLAKTQH
jgi:hypothetical protein